MAINAARRLTGKAVIEHKDLKPDEEALMREFGLIEDAQVPLFFIRIAEQRASALPWAQNMKSSPNPGPTMPRLLSPWLSLFDIKRAIGPSSLALARLGQARAGCARRLQK